MFSFITESISLVRVYYPVFLPVIGSILLVIIFLWFMRPRRFYIVRHGETLLNAQHVRQGEEGSLSKKGKEQADSAGKYLEQFPIQRILVSPYRRTQETAHIINAHLHKPIILSSLLAERKNPSEVIGKKTDNPIVTRITDEMDKQYHRDGYRYSDEENFIDLKNRARKCLKWLERNKTSETCVVTHSVFLKMFIAYLLYREQLHANEYIKLSFFNEANNAAITICEWHPWKSLSVTRGWTIVAYNEQPSI